MEEVGPVRMAGSGVCGRMYEVASQMCDANEIIRQ